MLSLNINISKHKYISGPVTSIWAVIGVEQQRLGGARCIAIPSASGKRHASRSGEPCWLVVRRQTVPRPSAQRVWSVNASGAVGSVRADPSRGRAYVGGGGGSSSAWTRCCVFNVPRIFFIDRAVLYWRWFLFSSTCHLRSVSVEFYEEFYVIKYH